MRVLIACLAHFCDSQGGAQRIVLDEATELHNRGTEVWVLAQGDGSRPEHEVRDGVHLLRYVPRPASAWNPARRSAHQKAATAVLVRHLPETNVIHGHTPLAFLAALGVYGDAVRSCYTIHSPARLEMAIVWRHAGLLRRLAAPLGLALINSMERECLRRSQITTALSQFTIGCISRIHGVELGRKIRLIPGWGETSRYVPLENRKLTKSQLGWPIEVPVFFTLRRLAPRMGLDRLLHACGKLRARRLQFHLMIGGTGPLREQLERQSRSLGLQDTVTFLGRIDDEKLPLAYGACDAFVLPTAELECFGLIAVEALAAGRPVLATPVGAIPEIINKFEPAWLSRSAEANDLAGLLESYLTGTLPEHNAAQLHEQTHREYGRWKLLPEYLEATVAARGSY
jgi:glycosyltransferase involved in cell wall biosynthesis